MRIITKWLAIMALVLSAVGIAQANTNSPRDMFIESESPLGFKETVEAIKNEASVMGWSILAVHTLHEVLAKKGHTIAPVAIMELCSGKYSVKLLQNDATRYVSSLLPCRVAVYEKSDGKVIISRMNTQMMGAMMEPTVKEVMLQAGADLETLIGKLGAKK
jgi:uncharacterized protein (DUF302 family)